MRTLRRLAATATITAMVAVVGVAAVPAANAGVAATPEAPPAAYTIINASLLLSCTLASVDLTDGTVTALPAGGSAEGCVRDLAVAPDGTVWGVRQLQEPPALVQFDPVTGAVLSSDEITGSFDLVALEEGGLTFDAGGTLYVQLVTDEPGCDSDAVCLYTVDPATAVATFVGGPGAANEETSMDILAADCAGNAATTESSRAGGGETTSLAESDDDVEAAELFRRLDSIDLTTGLVTDGPDFDEGFAVAGLDYDRVSGTLYAIGTFELNPVEESTSSTTAATDVAPAEFDSSLFIVDPATAEVTPVAPPSDPNINITTLGIGGTCPVPEPVPAPVVLEPTFTG